MKEQLELLEELNEIDKKIWAIEKEMNAFPEEIEEIEKSLGEGEETFLEIEEILLNHQKEKIDKDDELSVNVEKLKLFEGRLNSIKTNAEYQASLKEIDQSKKQSRALEEELLVLMEAIEEETNKVSEARAAFDEKKENVQAAIKAIQKRKDEKQKELNEILKERKEKNSAIDPKVAEIYNSLKVKLKGNLLANANNGSCSGCFLHIPPQLINDAMKYEKVCQCPHCHRILIVH
ncbi:MAG: hypothetical protein IME96_11305 [Proteobacteria bacterium]|nr:hypothetical protein [Pseudomonadota bacterium]